MRELEEVGEKWSLPSWGLEVLCRWVVQLCCFPLSSDAPSLAAWGNRKLCCPPQGMSHLFIPSGCTHSLCASISDGVTTWKSIDSPYLQHPIINHPETILELHSWLLRLRRCDQWMNKQLSRYCFEKITHILLTSSLATEKRQFIKQVYLICSVKFQLDISISTFIGGVSMLKETVHFVIII